MDFPAVSILIPAYNEEENIERCLDSLIGQDYPGKYEIIVIDGGSRDKTPELVERYSAKHGNVTLIRSERRRDVPESLNTGIGRAEGEVIWKLDADCEADRDSLRVLGRAYSADPRKNSFSASVHAENKEAHIAPAIRAFTSGDPKPGMISFRKDWFLERVGRYESLKGTGRTEITGRKIQQLDGVSVLEDLRVYERTPEDTWWLLGRYYYAGIADVQRKFLPLLFPTAGVLLVALSIFVYPLLILAPFPLYVAQAASFYKEFSRRRWLVEFLLLKPLTHISYLSGIMKGMALRFIQVFSQ